MKIIPAIDIKDGKVVRLLQGKFDEVTEYSSDPIAVAKNWESQGAEWLHVVDLDGAKDGHLANSDIIIRISQKLSIPVQTGGGIRNEGDIQKILDGGLSRVILGTKAIEDKDFLKTILAKWGDKIVISLDCSNGMVATRGWVDVSDLKAVDFAKELQVLGVQCVVYTDISRDGALSGPNFEGLKEILSAVNINVIASGGISSIEDIRKLLDLKAKNLVGAITGKAIYEGKLDLKEAVRLCSQSA